MNSDYVWLTEMGLKFLQNDYLLPGQTLDERVDEICDRASVLLKDSTFGYRFKTNLKKGWYSLSTPIWTNFGTTRGLPISCFGSFIGDSIESILTTQAEVGTMTKHGGGTSGYFGAIRSRGSKINGNGTSFGSVHFMQLFDNVINIISQGSTRRGQFAAYLPLSHKDIREFLTIRTEGSPLQDISFGVTVSNQFMENMIAGDRECREIWAEVLKSRSKTGYPYIMFSDNANEGRPEVYKDKDATITHSNLCVTGDQRAVTSTGIHTVKDLYKSGKEMVLFDGDKIVNASPMRLVEKNADVFEVITASGRSHKVTSYHKLKTSKGMIALRNLKVGDDLCVQRKKGLFGDFHYPELAFLYGLYQGDGTQSGDTVYLDLWENDFDLKDEIEECVSKVYKKEGWLTYEIMVPNRGLHSRATVVPTFFEQKPSDVGVKKVRLQSNKLKTKGFLKGIIPSWLWQSDEETQAAFLRGLYYADGTINVGKSKGNPLQLSLASVDKTYLRDVQIVLSNFGFKPSIHLLKNEGETSLPDGKGGTALYDCQTCWRLVISNKPDAIRFEELTGFVSRKGLYIENRKYRDNTKKHDKVESITFIGKEDVYCTTVDSKEHVWVCNGFITSNCSEIMLPDNEEESFVCDLSSMNILHFDAWKNTDAVELLTFFLDAVMDEFIEKTNNIPFMGRANRFARRHRSLGIGWIGYHSYLQSRMIPFESFSAKMVNVEIAKTIKEQAYAASAKLAALFGEPEMLKGYGRRNTTLCAIAPTKSSAFILGQVSEGIEPHRANYYIRDLEKGKFTVKNPHLEQYLTEIEKNSSDVWESILKHAGSVQHLDFLSDEVKDVFKTFQEISPKEIVIQASARQKYIDQGQSLNLMIHPAVPIKDVNALYMDAWRLGIKSFYYQYSVNAAQQLSRSILECTSCSS